MTLSCGALQAQRVLLAVGAHAGDMELTCGALLARQSRLGDRVVLLHLSLGERGRPGVAAVTYAAQKRREALDAARELGAEAIFGPYRDGEVPESDEGARWLAARIRAVKPAFVFTHSKRSIHKDHAAAHKLVEDAVLLASLDGIAQVEGTPWRGAKAVYYTENWEDAEGFHPYLYFALNETDAAAWRRAALKYEFTHAAFSGFDYVSYYEGLMKVRGAEARRPLAVAFDVDPMSKKRVLDALP